MLLPVTVVLGPTDTLLLELLFLELMSKDQRSEISNINYKGLSLALNRSVIKLQLELGDWQSYGRAAGFYMETFMITKSGKETQY